MHNNLARTKIPGPRSAQTDTSSRKKPRRRTQEERSATTRRRLIDAAVECLNDLGYLEATIEVVAERADVSRGAVQHHFGTRNDLLIAVVHDFGLLLAGLDTIASDLTVVERVNTAIDRTWDQVRSPHFVAVVQIWLATHHIPEISEISSKKIAQFERELDRQWQELFSELPTPPAKIAVVRHIVLAALRGLALRALYRKGRSPWTEEVAMLKSMVITAFS